MEQKYISEILKKFQSGYALPSLSVIAVKLVEIASDDSSSLNELTGLIEKDPSLAVRVLKMANSAFFKSLYPAATLKQAIMRIGFHHLRVLALSLSLKDTFPMGKVGQIDYGQFWRVSLYRGLLAKSLARELKACEPEEAFVTGLTLEVGFLVYYDHFLKGTNETVDAGIYPLELLLDTEKKSQGLNHREIGEIALRYWKFPEQIVECQRYYGYEDGSLEASMLSRICRIAGKLSALICYAKVDFQDVFVAASSLLRVPNGNNPPWSFSDETMYDVVIGALKEADEIARTFEVEIEGEKDLLGLMEKANCALSRLSEQMLQSQRGEIAQGPPSFEGLRARGDRSEEVEYTLQAVAHEIRNPLTVVGGFARRLAKTMDPSSEGWRYVEIILNETKRLEDALNEATKDLQR
ncbi:MAG: HDOD domain-containing protein [Proteobacteria bacterium]|nr:HDOD domain-containing protein [Pseudomonadota bacterium]